MLKKIACLLAIVFITGCTSAPTGSNNNSEPLYPSDFFSQIAIFITGNVQEDSRIAVYPFYGTGEIHPLSDYLIEGLTAELSITGEVEIINRTAIDLIIEEQKIQLSGLVAESSTVEIGAQLGATIIVTGFIEQNNLIIQIIDVETAANLGGRQLTIPKNLMSHLNEKSIIKQEFQIQEKGVFDITIVEEFSDSRIFAAITTETYSWGDKYFDGFSAIQPIDGGIKFSGTAELNDPELEGEMIFELKLPIDQFPGGSDGIYLKMKTYQSGIFGFGIGEEYIHHYISASGPDEFLIPWGYFGDTSPSFFSISFPSEENSLLFREATTNINFEIHEFGVYERKNGSSPGIISFEDDELRAVSTVKLYGFGEYMDYSENDQGIPRVNNGLKDFEYSINHKEEGAVGKALTYDFTLSGLSKEIEDLYDSEQDLTVYIDLIFSLTESSSNRIQFWLQSDIIRGGYADLYYQDGEGEYAGYQDLTISPLWSLQTMELERSVSGGKYRLVLALDIPERRVRAAVEKGELTLTFGLDEITIAE
ncbi:MAG: hypothetical protein JEY99_07580 [Spirochaetales bacterium]|nr:hypothetical protein [Spirochaetales bacterium]